MFDFRLSDDQRQIVTAVAGTLDRQKEIGAEGRAERGSAPDPGAGQVAHLGALGWVSLALPESCGGSDGTLVDEALVSYEYGRALASPDLLATQLAARIAYLVAKPDLASSFASGSRSVGFCVMSLSSIEGGSDSDCWLLQTSPVCEYLRVRGNAWEIVSAVGEVNLAASSRVACVDPEVSLYRMCAAHLEVLAAYPDAQGMLTERAMILLSAMLCGTSASSLDLAVAYAKMRKQFGRAIGEFQAIKHHCANMLVRARTAQAQVMHAAMVSAADLPGAAQQAAAALDVSIDAAIGNGELGIQIHGGMGFSAECAAHRYLKRAHLLRIIAADFLAARPSLFEQLAPSPTA